MAGEYVLTINVNQEGSGQSNAKPGIQDGSSGGDSASGVQRFTGVAKVAGALGFAKSQFDWAMNRVYIESGNTDAKQKYNFMSSLVGQIGGTALAFAVNPVVGAAAVGMTALSWFKKTEEFNYNRQVEGIGLAQMRERAGPSISRSR